MATSGRRRIAASDRQHERSAQTRAALIDGAIGALREVGYAGASAREIATRAGCAQGLVFYHFGSVTNLLLAALDEVSARRLTAYAELFEKSGSRLDIIESARAIFTEDLDAGHVAVLVELISGAQATPGLGEQVTGRLAPWREIAEAAVRKAASGSSIGQLLPARELGHLLMAGFLGLEVMAGLDGDRTAALAVFDRAAELVVLIESAGPQPAPGTERGGGT